jgi:hypothetical protein
MLMSAVGTGASVIGSMSQAADAEAQGVANSSAAAYEGFLDKELRLNDAAGVKKQTLEEANKIRDQSISFRGTQLAQQATSNVIVGEGSAQAMIDKTTELSTADVLATLYTGTAKALGLKQSGDMAATAGVNRGNAIYAKAQADSNTAMFKAAGSLLSGAGDIYEKGSKSGFFSTTQNRAPVRDAYIRQIG